MTKHLIKFILCCVFSFSVTTSFADTASLSKALTPKVSVTGQMTTDKFKNLMRKGFKSVIVNRPDQETGNLTTANELREIAEQAHVSLIYQPVISGQITETDAEEFAKYYNSLPKPILLVCKSGARSTVLFNQAKSLGLLNE